MGTLAIKYPFHFSHVCSSHTTGPLFCKIILLACQMGLEFDKYYKQELLIVWASGVFMRVFLKQGKLRTTGKVKIYIELI